MKANSALLAPPTSQGVNQFLKGADKGVYINSEGQLVNNATVLRHEAGELWDRTIIDVARVRLRAVDDLRKRGLMFSLGGLGTILSMWERAGDMTGASFDMDGRTRSQKDRLTFDNVGVPVPIIHKEWELGERVILATQQRGEGIDTTQMRIATRIVMEGIEGMLFNGVPNMLVSGLGIYGYTTAPQRNTYTLTANWTSATGAAIITDVKAMLQIMVNKRKVGPFILYVAKDISVHLGSDYSADKGSNTIKERILQFDDISEIASSDMLAAGDVLLIQLDSETVDMAVASDIRNLQWSTHPMSTDYMVFGAMVPRIKSDRDGNCGIVHGS